MNRLGIFRIIALVEGVTTIALFLVAMPLKYWAGIESPMRPIGLTHGLAWLTYVVAMLACLPGYRFSAAEWIRTFIFALFPFGTFINDPLIRRKQRARQTLSA